MSATAIISWVCAINNLYSPKREATHIAYNPPNSTQAHMLVLAKLFTTICILASTVGVTAGWRNITIDDQFGDERTQNVPTFYRSTIGLSGALAGQQSLAYNGTWHDSTQWIGTPATSVNFGFTGVCLYVYSITLNLARGSELHAFADYKFVIDGELVGRYTRIPQETDGPPYFFNTLVYDNTTLDNKFHNFSVVLDSTEQPVLLLFDYAVYTIVEEDAVNTTTPLLSQPSPSPDVADRSKPSSVVILGSTLGVVAFLICAGLLSLVVRQYGQTPRVFNFRNKTHTTITHNPLLVLNPVSPALIHRPEPREVVSGGHEDMIMDLRQKIQDLRVEKQAMRAALGIVSSE